MTVRVLSFVFLLILLTPAFVWSQTAPPLGYGEVLDMAADGPNTACLQLGQRKVDFELTTQQLGELKTKGGTDQFIDCIRKNPAPATLVIQCKPVDCEAFVGVQKLGQTKEGGLSIQLPSGM